MLLSNYTLDEWSAVLEQHGRKCLRCGAMDKVLTRDHVVPLSLGGSDTIDNIQPLCGSCNSSKGTRSLDFRTLEGILESSDYYTVGDASKLLGVTEGRIRQMLGAGEIEGNKEPLSDRWRIPQHVIHALREQRKPAVYAQGLEVADPGPWIERAISLERELGHLEGRLELTQYTESTIREALERERERADRAERELEELRGRGFWARLLGQRS